MKYLIFATLIFATSCQPKPQRRDFTTELAALKKQAETEGLQDEYTVLTALEVAVKIDRKKELSEKVKEWATEEKKRLLK